MSNFLASPNAPAWVQAVGSVGAILIAVWAPIWQRGVARRDAEAERKRNDKEALKRLVSALKAEVDAAMEAAERVQDVMNDVLGGVVKARRVGKEVKDGRPLDVVLTDALVYRQSGGDVGRLPAEIAGKIVTFYTRALEIPRIARIGASAERSAEVLLSLLPRLRMTGVILIDALEQYERSDYASDIRLVFDKAKLKAAADKIGYPIEEIARQRGISV